MASSRLGLRCALDQLSPVGIAARRILVTPRARWGSPSCLCAVPSAKRFAHQSAVRGDAPPAPSVQKIEQQQQRVTSALISAPLPGTLIPPPISQWPRGMAFFRFALEVYKSKGRAWLQAFLVALMSRPKPWKSGLLKLNNNGIPPMAKEMYSDMLQALATGDREKLKAICTVHYLTPLLVSLDKRPRTRRYKWELVKWTGKARLAAQSIVPMATGGKSDMIRQVTVHLPSRQRRIEYVWDAGARDWEVVSEKEADVDEHLILVSVVSAGTYQQSEWRILSATRPSTPKEWENEKRLVEKAQKIEMEQYKL